MPQEKITILINEIKSTRTSQKTPERPRILDFWVKMEGWIHIPTLITYQKYSKIVKGRTWDEAKPNSKRILSRRKRNKWISRHKKTESLAGGNKSCIPERLRNWQYWASLKMWVKGKRLLKKKV